MAPRRVSTRRRGLSPSPMTTTTNTGTGLNSPAPYDSISPAPQKSTPGTTPSRDGEASSRKTGITRKKKRPLSSDSELTDIGADVITTTKRATKRRATVPDVIVELSTKGQVSHASGSVSATKGAGRSAGRSSTEDIAMGKGKGRAFPVEEIVESDPSGSESEFDASSTDHSVIGGDGERSRRRISSASRRSHSRVTRATKTTQFMQLDTALDSDDLDSTSEIAEDLALIAGAAENDEEEAADLDAAIKASLALTPAPSSSRGKSQAPSTSRAAMAALRALAAEKRAGTSQVVDDEDAWLPAEEEEEMMSELSSDELDSDYARPKKKGRSVSGKGKSKGSGKSVTVMSTDKKKSTSLKEMRATRRILEQERRRLLAPIKHEQYAMSRKLGRKLTYAEKSTIALYYHHPELKTAWGDLEADIPIREPERAPQPPGFKATLLPFQQESVSWMRKQEKGVWGGGILADEMGMGKTVQMLGLLSADRRKPNLIVAPTVAILQWRNEIEAHTTGFTTLVWHGNSRETKVSDIAENDIVLTTYAVLESAFRKQEKGFKRGDMQVKQKSPIHQIEWARIILDEAHNIKERATNTAKGTFELKGTYKWCLSGTPLQNRVGELYSLIRFLGGDPFAYYFCKRCECKSLSWKFSNKKTCDDCGHSPMLHTCFWNNEILTPIQKNALSGPGRTAFKKLKILLDRMMLRRTKIERADDLGLPPRTIIVRREYFSPEEKELYLSLFSDAKRQFSTYVDAGTLLNNYSNIFSLLTRMRQMACHPDLVLKSRRNVDLSGEIVEAAICRICHDVAEDAIKSACHHLFDRTCIQQYVEACGQDKPACPVCHLDLSIDLEAPAIEQDEAATKKARQGILGRLDHDNWRSSTKIEALLEELDALRRRDATTKSIVFSQFVNFLDLIAWRLQKAGFIICRLEGTMSPQARDATIKHFMNNVEVTVFLVSLKAGGVALNLTEASRVYLMDSWWNPAVEFQAMDRIHRLGQHRPVHAIKLVVEDSIESRIIQLQEKKSAMVDATLSADDTAMGRLTAEDLGFLFRL